MVITPEMRKSFETMKTRMTTAPVLGFPYFRGPKAGLFVLDSDFSLDQVESDYVNHAEWPNQSHLTIRFRAS